MKGFMEIIRNDGEKVRLEYSRPLTLDDLKKAVGGFIEIVPMFNDYPDRLDDQKLLTSVVVFCNEEGKLNGLPLNSTATIHWQSSLDRWQAAQGHKLTRLQDFLVGQVAVVWGDSEFMEAL